MSNAYEYMESVGLDHFSADEWPVPEDLRYVDARVVIKLDQLRKAFGSPIYPSQSPKGLVRRTGSTTSRHYIGDGSLGLAVDIFPSERSLDCWVEALAMPEWRGIGVYLDTDINTMQPGPMLHLDIDETRPQRTLWTRQGEYVLKDREPRRFWKLIYEASKI